MQGHNSWSSYLLKALHCSDSRLAWPDPWVLKVCTSDNVQFCKTLHTVGYFLGIKMYLRHICVWGTCRHVHTYNLRTAMCSWNTTGLFGWWAVCKSEFLTSFFNSWQNRICWPFQRKSRNICGSWLGQPVCVKQMNWQDHLKEFTRLIKQSFIVKININYYRFILGIFKECTTSVIIWKVKIILSEVLLEKTWTIHSQTFDSKRVSILIEAVLPK